MPPIVASPRRATLAVAVVPAASVVLIGVLVRPNPPSFSTDVTGDSALAALALPELDGAFDRVSIAVIDGDTVTYAHFGADSSTTYEIGSVTKTFTSLLLADGVERGEVTADTTPGALLPLGDAPAADVTLSELASHRSGLPRTAPIAFQHTLVLIGSPHRDPYVESADGVIAQGRAATVHRRAVGPLKPPG